MGGASLAWSRRKADPYFRDLYFVGRGLDIGARGDPLKDLVAADPEAFPRITSIDEWNYEEHGDATHLTAEEPYDFIHASHVLEHVRDPGLAAQAWFEALRVGGHLVVLVPSFVMYEREIWPPHVNTDHKSRWLEDSAWPYGDHSDVWDVHRFTHHVTKAIRTVSIRYLDLGFNPDLPVTQDQTVTPGVECAIEFVCRKGRR